MKKIFLNIILLCSLSVFAQDFEVSPLSLNFSVEPGESQTKFLKIKNHRNKTETFVLNLSDYTINMNGKESFVDAGSLKNSIANWISVAPSFFELQPNEEVQISVTLQQPSNDYSSKWGMIFIKTAKEQTAFSVDKGISAGMNISGRIAVNVLQTPSTNKSYKAKIDNLKEVTKKEDENRVFSAIVNNVSDIITQCKVNLIVTNIKSSEEFVLEPQEFLLYPKTSRKVLLTINKPLPKGTYALSAILDYGSKSNLEGTQIIIEVD